MPLALWVLFTSAMVAYCPFVRSKKLVFLLAVALGCDRAPPGPAPASTPSAAASPAPNEPPAQPPKAASPPANEPEDDTSEGAIDLDPADAKRLDTIVLQAIERGDIPGAVVLVVVQDRVVFHRAYGLRAKEPVPRAMTKDTVFDLASLTKPIATATSIALLAERGRLRFSDPISRYIPEFSEGDKATVTIEQLLLHTSGLPADNALADYAGERAKALGRVFSVALASPPKEAFRYSDLGYVMLGETASRASSISLDAFTHGALFAPLGMQDTLFSPPDALKSRIAPTEKLGDEMLLGKVHDPRARALGGEAGHAGLFSTAFDLGRFARMLLGNGKLDGTRVLAESTVRALFAAHDIPAPKASSPPSQAPPPAPPAPAQRAYFGAIHGSAISHTGFTGTSFWIDPQRKVAIVVLSNRVHPDGKGSADRLRREIHEAALSAALRVKQKVRVESGIDVLEASGLEALRGHEIALLTHAAGRTKNGRSSLDVLARAPGVKLVSLLSPEHGLRSTSEGSVDDAKDARTGLTIHSLYGAQKRPTAAMLEGADTLVIDLQDAGARFYTYATTLGYALEAAAKLGVRVLVLDRPNPLGGAKIEGPTLDEGRESFVGYHRVPVRHGMTLGELATMFNGERKIGADLTVVKMKGWKRSALFADTDLAWTPPSPNLKSAAAALLYPGVGLVELTNVSVGRGTAKPFEQVGAPWIDADKLVRALAAAGLRGVSVSQASFRPSASTFAGETCHGVSFVVTEPAAFEAVPLGLAIAVALRRLHPEAFRPAGLATLLGHARAFEAITAGEPLDRVLATFANDAQAFAERRKPFLLY